MSSAVEAVPFKSITIGINIKSVVNRSLPFPHVQSIAWPAVCPLWVCRCTLNLEVNILCSTVQGE